MAYSLLQHAIASGSNAATTPAKDTTGADLIVLAVMSPSAAAGDPNVANFSDSAGNTWTPLTAVSQTFGSTVCMRFFYCHNPVTSASHTFTYSENFANPVMTMQAFSGSGASPFDVENGFIDLFAGSASTVQPGSITPTQNNELVVSAFYVNIDPPSTPSVDSGFTTMDFGTQSGVPAELGMGYLVQGTAAAVNPTWTTAACSKHAAIIASFKAAAGGGGGTAVPVFRRHYQTMQVR